MIDFHGHVERDIVTKRYRIEDVIRDMDANGIDIRMISTLRGRSIREQNEAMVEFARQYPGRLWACGVLNPKEDDCVEEAERLAGLSEVKAFEFNPWEYGFLPEEWEYHLDPILEIAGREGLPVKLFAGWGPRTMPQQWEKYIKRHPDVTFVVLHIGGIDFGYGSIPFIRAYNNVMCETSNQTEMQVLHEAFKQLPPEKFLFGSNYPDQITKCSIDTFQLLQLNSDYKKAMFEGNAKRIVRGSREGGKGIEPGKGN